MKTFPCIASFCSWKFNKDFTIQIIFYLVACNCLVTGQQVSFLHKVPKGMWTRLMKWFVFFSILVIIDDITFLKFTIYPARQCWLTWEEREWSFWPLALFEQIQLSYLLEFYGNFFYFLEIIETYLRTKNKDDQRYYRMMTMMTSGHGLAPVY